MDHDRGVGSVGSLRAGEVSEFMKSDDADVKYPEWSVTPIFLLGMKICYIPEIFE
jgi:hypothetical protein